MTGRAVAVAVGLLLAGGPAPGQDGGAYAPEGFAEYRPIVVRFRPTERVAPLPADAASLTGPLVADLPPGAVESLVGRGFAVVRRGRPGFLDVYEEAARRGAAVHYPADVFLDAHTRLMARTLRTLEDRRLIALLEALATALAGALAGPVEGSGEGSGHALARAWAHCLLALGGDLARTPADLRPVVARELACVLAADGRRTSPLLGREVDYSAFRVGRAYTGDPRRLAHAHRVVWAGTVGFRLEGVELEAARALAAALDEARIGRVPAADLRRDLVAAIHFFTGAAADLDLEGLRRGDRPPADLPIGDPDRVPGVHLLPATALPDAAILQRLAHPRVGRASDPRLFPSALDALAVFGSRRAAAALSAAGDDRHAGYGEARLALAERFAPFLPFDRRRWGQTTYWGLLHSLRPLLAPDATAPWAFARSDDWSDRRLVACLAGRVDGQLEGPPGAARRPLSGTPPPGGLVLAPPAFLARLEALVRMTREGLLARDELRRGLPGPGSPGDLIEPLVRFESILAAAREVAIAQREGRPVPAALDRRLAGLAVELGELPIHPVAAGGVAVDFTLHVTGRGTYHRIGSSGPVDDLLVVGPGSTVFVGPASRWSEAVVADPPPTAPRADAPPPAFARGWSFEP